MSETIRPDLPPPEPHSAVHANGAANSAATDDAPISVPARIKRGASFGLSAVLSPYIVLPVGTAAIIGSLAANRRDWLTYAAISVFFSTILPALFVIMQVKRGKITDVHIMDRSQRGAPFWVAIASSAVGAVVLKLMGATMEIWSISAVLALNGMILTWITSFWKISMHVAVLTATVTAALMMIPEVQAPPLLLLIPALMWARVTRGRHTIWQGVAGASLSAFITALCFFGLRFIYDPATRKTVLHFLGRA